MEKGLVCDVSCVEVCVPCWTQLFAVFAVATASVDDVVVCGARPDNPHTTGKLLLTDSRGAFLTAIVGVTVGMCLWNIFSAAALRLFQSHKYRSSLTFHWHFTIKWNLFSFSSLSALSF